MLLIFTYFLIGFDLFWSLLMLLFALFDSINYLNFVNLLKNKIYLKLLN